MSRTEKLLTAIVDGDMQNLPDPQSNVEEILSAIIDSDIGEAPEPESRVEALLIDVGKMMEEGYEYPSASGVKF